MHTDTPSLPGYCPRCRRTVDSIDDAPICPSCGDRRLRQGYCPVCEAFQSREPGEPCPKHDVPLWDGPPAAPVDVEGPWVELAQYADALDAQPLRIRLEAEGIPTLIEGERMGSRSMYQVATGGVTLKVPEALSADARVLLDQTWSKDALALGVEDEDDWDDFSGESDVSGDRGDGDSSWRRTARTLVLIWLTLSGIYFVARIITFIGHLLGG